MEDEPARRYAYFVTMTDRFLSNWSAPGLNKTSKLVACCDTYDEALIVRQNAMHRPEMRYINIVESKPWYSPLYYTVSYITRESAPRWYQAGGFKGQK